MIEANRHRCRNPLHQRWEGEPELLKLLFVSSLIVPIAFGQISLTTAQIAKRVSPSVVVIQGKTDSGEVLGSGFIVSKDGNIVTNLHVIRDMKTASVHLANGRTLDSVFVLATDERRDLAIIHISGFDPQKHDGDIFDQILDPIPQRSQVLDLGNSNSVSVGEPVVVVGSPQGLEGTVTAGILSSVRDSGEGFKVLQADAAVNPGNSGGPLVNSKGQAIGVVSFKLRSAEGLNFAIPINYVRELLNNLHNPLTLGQMRNALSASVTAEPNPADLSLKDSLEWLNLTLASEPFNYVIASNGEVWNVSQEHALEDRESCAPTFSTLMRFRKSGTHDWISEVSTERTRVPLAEIVTTIISKDKLLPDISSGEKWSYNVFLYTKAKTLSSVVSEPSKQPVTTNVDFAVMPFHDESVAKRALAVVRHSTDLCKTTSAQRANKDASPSLKETLDWLKDKIPVATIQSVRSNGQIPMSATFESTVWAFDSCTVAFGRLTTIRSAMYTTQATTRYTLPLGALTGSSITQVEYWPFGNFVKGDRYGYRLSLTSTSKDISLTYIGHDVPADESTDTLYLIFRDEELARRVGTAFLHAAGLCRKREVF